MNEMSETPVFVISLRRDYSRRDALRIGLGEEWEKITVVDAVDVSQASVFELKECEKNLQNPLSSTERACALSHLKAMRMFLDSDAPACIILEDDVIGDGSALKRALQIVSGMSDGAMCLLGGQQGLRNTKYVYGKKNEIYGIELFSIPRVSWRFLSRACCYGVTRYSAAAIVGCQEDCLSRADDWRRFFPKVLKVLAVGLFSHPLDLSNSHLEVQRMRALEGKGVLRRILDDGLIYTCETAAIKIVLPRIAKLFGIERFQGEGLS